MSTETRPRDAIDGVSYDEMCHVFPDIHPDRAFCGVPRDEQPVHGEVMEVDILRGMPFCPWCGAPRCPKCGETTR